MSKKMKVYLVAVTIIVLLAAGGSFYFYQFWLPAKQMKIQLGLASDKFPWRDYSQAELDKMYPQIKYADIPTRVTPEETYAKFREALKTNNLELALAQLSVEGNNYNKNVEKLKKAYSDRKFISSLNLYPDKVWRSNFGESGGNLCYEQAIEDSQSVGCTCFLKDASGDWKMDSL